jgi:putative flippase GtrA
MFLKFIKFCIVGFSGLLIDLSITWFLKEKVKINKFVANSIGFSFAVTTNFMLNRWWTFSSHEINIEVQYLSFLLVSLIGLLLNNLIIYILIKKKNLNFYIAKLMAIAFVTIWNFIANYLITFKR